MYKSNVPIFEYKIAPLGLQHSLLSQRGFCYIREFYWTAKFDIIIMEDRNNPYFALS